MKTDQAPAQQPAAAPQAKIKAGKDKQIYVFRDLHLKITFSGGKVVAVE
jgi:hypothetical protein